MVVTKRIHPVSELEKLQLLGGTPRSVAEATQVVAGSSIELVIVVDPLAVEDALTVAAVTV
jgi:hypothetical protein